MIRVAITTYREHRDTERLAGDGEVQDMSQAEAQSKGMDFDTFENMDETVITYGLTVLFWTAAPWAPLATLGMNVIECWGDAKMLLRTAKRPYPLRTKDNEPWDTAF